jgi:alanyl-tRNA synthetase
MKYYVYINDDINSKITFEYEEQNAIINNNEIIRKIFIQVSDSVIKKGITAKNLLNVFYFYCKGKGGGNNNKCQGSIINNLNKIEYDKQKVKEYIEKTLD